MIADSIRTGAYCNALRRAVKPGAVVVDIGTGTGIFALLACRFGARKVYAIEPSGAIAVAREIAAANGCQDRIEFIEELSTKVDLPEHADVIVSDLRGVLPLFEQHLPSIIDARRRLLAPGGNLIPKRDILWSAVVETPQNYDPLIQPWVRERFQLNMDAASQIVTNVWKKARVTPDQLLTKPYCWATLDYLNLESPNVSSEMTFQVMRPGTAHGFVMWFDTFLDDGIEFSNAPGQPKLIYGSGFFPWSSPVDLVPDDTVSVGLRANLVGSDYIWSWETRVCGNDSGQAKAHFRQSTFFGSAFSSVRLRKRATSYLANLNDDGQIDKFILAMMDGNTSLGEIATEVCSRFPRDFPAWQEALTHVGDLSVRYSR